MPALRLYLVSPSIDREDVPRLQNEEMAGAEAVTCSHQPPCGEKAHPLVCQSRTKYEELYRKGWILRPLLVRLLRKHNVPLSADLDRTAAPGLFKNEL